MCACASVITRDSMKIHLMCTFGQLVPSSLCSGQKLSLPPTPIPGSASWSLGPDRPSSGLQTLPALELGRRHLNWQQNARKFPQAGLGLEHKVLCAASWLLPPRAVLVRPWASSASFWQEVPGTWVGGSGRPVQGQRKGCSFQVRGPLCSGLRKRVAVK